MSNPSCSEPVSDEMLSAYVDGELSPSDVLVVERWLKSSPQARQKVADFRRLSGLLQDLPQEELPEEFASAVLVQAERQMLLPAQRQPALPSVLKKVRFWSVSVGLPAAAACLVIAIQWNQQKAVQEVPDFVHAKASRAMSDRDRAAEKSNEVTPDRRDDVQPMPGSALAKGALADSTGGVPSTDSPPPAVSVADTTSGRLESAIAIHETADGRPAGNESIATVLDQIKELNDAGRIPVVRVFVVDRQDGLEVLQVTLASQKIFRDESSSAAGSRTPEESPSDQRALFVVASAKELTSALKALEAKSDAIGSWVLSDPVELARFDQKSKERMAELIALVAGGRPEPPSGMVAGAAAAVASPSEPELASNDNSTRRPSSRKTTPKKAVASRGPSTPDRATSPDREGAGLADVGVARPGRRSPPTSGRQVLVTMDESIPSSPIGGTRGGAPATRSQVTEAPESDSTGIRSVSIDRRPPMQVLFVIERQASPPAAAPPAKESPGGGAA